MLIRSRLVTESLNIAIAVPDSSKGGSLWLRHDLRLHNAFLKTSIYVRNSLIKTGFTTYHPCGTCATMPRDLHGVLEERLRVDGVSGLRVVDASVFPLIPRGNIRSSVYALAKRAADSINDALRAI
ncbi:hypothetical protein MRB53_041031 [Persea americana]|nr:hypothetical protein MRB53_041031 [Persea americana]